MERGTFHPAEQAAKQGDRVAAYGLMRQTLIENPTHVPGWIEINKLEEAQRVMRDNRTKSLRNAKREYLRKSALPGECVSW